MKKVLILGVSGMVGHKLFADLSQRTEFEVWATARHKKTVTDFFAAELLDRIIDQVDVKDMTTVTAAIDQVKPDVLICCVGITKQLVDEAKPLEAIAVNSLMPHLLAQVCHQSGVRLIQIATDCVFNGQKGSYLESDPSDATDTYGRTKFLGEVYYPHCLTIRTSFIGHELTTAHGLLGWFLAQEGQAKGYAKAIYSGLPTVEIARVMAEYILPNETLTGLYHVSSEPINKYDLLTLIAKQYGKTITITPDDSVRIDRSLNSDRFRQATGWQPKAWPELIAAMHQDYTTASYYTK